MRFAYFLVLLLASLTTSSLSMDGHRAKGGKHRVHDLSQKLEEELVPLAAQETAEEIEADVAQRVVLVTDENLRREGENEEVRRKHTESHAVLEDKESKLAMTRSRKVEFETELQEASRPGPSGETR